MKKILLVFCLFLLNGCTIYSTEKTQIWLLCYKDEELLRSGMYASDELHYKCGGRKFIQIRTKFGGNPDHKFVIDLNKKDSDNKLP